MPNRYVFPNPHPCLRKANDAWVLAQEIAEWLFNIIFFVEMVLKIFCLKAFNPNATSHAS